MSRTQSRLIKDADRFRLPKISTVAETLVHDDDGVYGPAHSNDPLQLGREGTFSEEELYRVWAYLRGGSLTNLRRGQYRYHLSTDDAARSWCFPRRNVSG